MRTFNYCLAFFGFAAGYFSMGGLRAGGATYMLESGKDLGAIKFAGCWASDRAMSSHLQEVAAAVSLLDMSRPHHDRLKAVHLSFGGLRLPPLNRTPASLLSASCRSRLAEPPMPSLPQGLQPFR